MPEGGNGSQEMISCQGSRGSECLGLVVFDLDGTLLRNKTVCEILAEPLGREQRMRELEKIEDLEEVRLAREEIVQWYQGRSPLELTSFLSPEHLTRGAREACNTLRQLGVKVAIASLTWLFAVRWFGELLGVDYTLGTRIFPLGQIYHCWPDDKASWVRSLRMELGLEQSQVAAVGDSFGDVPMLNEVGIPVFVGHSTPSGLPSNIMNMPDASIDEIVKSVLDVACHFDDAAFCGKMPQNNPE